MNLYEFENELNEKLVKAIFSEIRLEDWSGFSREEIKKKPIINLVRKNGALFVWFRIREHIAKHIGHSSVVTNLGRLIYVPKAKYQPSWKKREKAEVGETYHEYGKRTRDPKRETFYHYLRAHRKLKLAKVLSWPRVSVARPARLEILERLYTIRVGDTEDLRLLTLKILNLFVEFAGTSSRYFYVE